MDTVTIEIKPSDIEAAKAAAMSAWAAGSETVHIDPKMLFAMVHTLYTMTTVGSDFMTMEAAVRQGAEPIITVPIMWGRA